MITKMAYCILTVSLVIQSFDFTVGYKKKGLWKKWLLWCHIFLLPWVLPFLLGNHLCAFSDLDRSLCHSTPLCPLFLTCLFVNLSLFCSNYALICLKVIMPHARTHLSFVHLISFTGAVCDDYWYIVKTCFWLVNKWDGIECIRGEHIWVLLN